jgi:enolase
MLAGSGLPTTVPRLAIPALDVENGGGKLKFRTVWLTTSSGVTASEGAEKLSLAYKSLQALMSKKVPVVAQSDGSFSLKADKPEHVFDLIDDAIKAVGLTTEDIQILLEANVTYNAEKRKFEMVAGQLKTAAEVVAVYADLVHKRQLVAGIFDPFPVDHPVAWRLLSEAVGDRCFCGGGQDAKCRVEALLAVPPEVETEEPEKGGKVGEPEDGVGQASTALVPFGGGILLSMADLRTVSQTVAVVAAAKKNKFITMLVGTPGSMNTVTVDLAAGLSVDYLVVEGPSGFGAARINRHSQIAAAVAPNESA